ncbi:hypothetical protein ASE38_06790 [Cellulomonas sp. Root930]|nr:hypothetical protein ASE38_06790 [Cellulomonas sp. Root930]
MDNSDQVARLIATYRSHVLNPEAWELAAEPARSAVAAAAPTSREGAKLLLWSLCTFLSTPCGWQREDAPDLAVLLSDAAIGRFVTQFRGPVRTRETHVMNLRALQRALAGIEPVAGKPRAARRVAGAEITRVHAATLRASLATTAAVFGARTGDALAETELRGLGETLVDSAPQANVTEVAVGIVDGDLGAAEAYLGTPDVRPVTELVRAKSTITTATTAPSQRQQLARARAERAAYRSLTGGPRVAAHTDLDTLDPHILATIERYRPQQVAASTWHAVRPLTIQMVAGFNPPSNVTARNTATIVVAFLCWVWERPGRAESGPPTALELLSPNLVDAYVRRPVDRKGHPVSGASISTARSTLRRCIRSLDADHVAVAMPHEAIDPPYTPEECEALAALALAQPTPGRERNACFLVGLALGAGLSPKDLRHVRRRDIRDVDDAGLGNYLTVTVPAGHAPRTVPIRRQYEPLVRRALDLTEPGADTLVLGRKETRRNVTELARRNIVTARSGEVVEIEPRRLRTTWLFACMNAAVPLSVLLEMAGLRTARSLADLLPLCPTPDPKVVDHALADLADAPIGERSGSAGAR